MAETSSTGVADDHGRRRKENRADRSPRTRAPATSARAARRAAADGRRPCGASTPTHPRRLEGPSLRGLRALRGSARRRTTGPGRRARRGRGSPRVRRSRVPSPDPGPLVVHTSGSVLVATDALLAHLPQLARLADDTEADGHRLALLALDAPPGPLRAALDRCERGAYETADAARRIHAALVVAEAGYATAERIATRFHDIASDWLAALVGRAAVFALPPIVLGGWLGWGALPGDDAGKKAARAAAGRWSIPNSSRARSSRRSSGASSREPTTPHSDSWVFPSRWDSSSASTVWVCSGSTRAPPCSWPRAPSPARGCCTRRRSASTASRRRPRRCAERCRRPAFARARREAGAHRALLGPRTR